MKTKLRALELKATKKEPTSQQDFLNLILRAQNSSTDNNIKALGVTQSFAENTRSTVHCSPIAQPTPKISPPTSTTAQIHNPSRSNFRAKKNPLFTSTVEESEIQIAPDSDELC
jgi:hypothetical protein